VNPKNYGRTEDDVSEDDEDTRLFSVVANDEEQYSIWPIDKPTPPGWRAAGKTGPKTECLQYINQVWTDMRPASLRQRMAQLEIRNETDG
jgi:MbtH protein